MLEFWKNFIASGFWQAILFIVIVGIVISIIIGILRFLFKDVNFNNTSSVRKTIYNIIYWGSFIAVFFIIWHIRQGVGWLVFGILGIIYLIGSIIGILFSKNTGQNYEYYNSLAIAKGTAGERLRQEGRVNEALECDFQGISLMEKAIELSINAPEEKKIQYKRDIIIACIYVACDLFKMGKLFESINYCEKIIIYAKDIPLNDLKNSILEHASNYDERNSEWIERNFGELGLEKSLDIGKRLRAIIN